MGKEVELDEEVEEVTGPLTLDEASFIDVTEVAEKAGFIHPVRISRSLYERCLTIRSEDADVTDEDRLWMFLFGLQENPEEPPEACQKLWTCTFEMTEHWYGFGKIKVVRSGDTVSEHVITLMLPTD